MTRGFSMTSSVKNIPCKVDALSLTWSPKELLKVKQLAKIGASLKKGTVLEAQQSSLNRHLSSLERKKNQQLLDAKAFDSAEYSGILSRYEEACKNITREYNERSYKNLDLSSLTLAESEVAARYELSDMLKGEMVVDTSLKYSDNLENLLDNIGVNLLDVLCCGEAERFICSLNKVFAAETYMWTVVNNATGKFNYQYSANLYADGEHAGVIAWGGKNLGCYVSFMGLGCDALDMARLYKEIRYIPEMKITRIDLAHDDFAGKHSVAVARKFAKKGGFNTGGRPTSYMYVESGSLSSKALKENFKDIKECSGQSSKSTAKKSYGFMPTKGRTLYIGSRESGKLLRVYEKGKQMGDPKDKWVRWELELHSSQRVIPLDAMVNCSEYLAGAYPCLSFLNEEQQTIKTIIKASKMTVHRIIENQVISTRKAINMMRHVCGLSDSEIVAKFLDDIKEPFSREAYPKRLNIPITEQQFISQLPIN